MESKKHGLIDLYNVRVLEDEKLLLCSWKRNYPDTEVNEK